jgi:hypothetical protein
VNIRSQIRRPKWGKKVKPNSPKKIRSLISNRIYDTLFVA